MSTDNPDVSGSITPSPGILLMTGEACQLYGSRRDIEVMLKQHYNYPLQPYCKVGINEWLVAYGITSQPSEHNYNSGEDGISVVFDGYLSDYVGPGLHVSFNNSFARTIGELYRLFGLSFLNDLRGSFICLISDQRQEKAYLFSDRQGSRPMFLRDLADSSVIYAPQVKFLAALKPRLERLKYSAVGQFLIRGCFYGNDTLYEDIHKLPQANITTFSRGKTDSQQYWSYQFKVSKETVPDSKLLDEFDILLSKATRRLLDVARNPVLLLSGGLDSRLMLAYLLKEKASHIPTMSYMVHNTDGEDHIVAKRLSDYCGLQHETYEINENDYQSIAQKEVLAVDGRVQVLDSPSNRWEHIGKHHDCIFIGDECFGWGRTTSTVSEALSVIGWFNLDSTHRIADWLKPEVRRSIYSEIKTIQNHLVSQTGETEPDNIKDKLYYTERMGNMLNGYGARRLWLMEQARPFLDEDLMEFISRLPASKRRDKSLAWKLMEEKFPDLHSIPYSRRDSVPWWPPQFVQITEKNEVLCNFIVSSLTENLNPQLAEMFDQKRLAETVSLLFQNRHIPPLRRDWWVHIPGLWRFSRDRYDKVGPVRSALRLLGINLYLND